jgi:hypothetical protein
MEAPEVVRRYSDSMAQLVVWLCHQCYDANLISDGSGDGLQIRWGREAQWFDSTWSAALLFLSKLSPRIMLRISLVTGALCTETFLC